MERFIHKKEILTNPKEDKMLKTVFSFTINVWRALFWYKLQIQTFYIKNINRSRMIDKNNWALIPLPWELLRN